MIQSGQWVKLLAFGGEHIVRRVVRETDRSVVVCTDEEYDRAHRENREPQAVGFLKESVLGTFDTPPA